TNHLHMPTSAPAVPLFILHLIPPPPRSPLFPYTTLFRSLIIRMSTSGARLRDSAHTHPAASTTALANRPTVRADVQPQLGPSLTDRKSTRLNSSHLGTSYAVFSLKKKTAPMLLNITSTVI